jgi:hypothetical protein
VNAAQPADTILVGPGTFYEGVVITKPLSLSSLGATIDATGQPNGIFVNGMAATGLSAVHISGFTIQNAQFEGILVANASAVTISQNTVQNNDKALSGGHCPSRPSFEPGEDGDCGEGIHLLGADHAVVIKNSVHGNSGGILASDDTAAVHDNLISLNTVEDNAYACGIVLASHVSDPATGNVIPFGVYHNTVYKNTSNSNGLSNGGGAGVGIFASIPGAQAYGNVVVENTLLNNGLPGITLHAHVPGQNLNDNVLVGNILSGNGADTADATTPGTAGINIYGAGAITGNIVAENYISGESYDVVVKTPALVQVEFNMLMGGKVGVDNLGLVGPVDATSNWWGCSLGPVLGAGCAKSVGMNMDNEPWLLLAPQ